MLEKIELLTVDEAAFVLGLGRSKMYQLIKTGEIGTMKIGRSRRVSRGQIAEFIKKMGG